MQEKKISVFFEEVLQWFILSKAQKEKIIYHASRHENHLMTIRVSSLLGDASKKLAINEKVSDARVISTP